MFHEYTRYNYFDYLLILVVAFAKCQPKKKNLLTSPVLVYKTISAAEARISTTSTPRSYISAMLLVLKSLLFFCLDIFEPKTCGSYKYSSVAENNVRLFTTKVIKKSRETTREI